MMEENKLDKILEALLLASDQPLSVEQMHRLLSADLSAGKNDIREALERLAASYENRPAQLKEVGSGFRLQIRTEYSDCVGRLWQEKPPKYSRALLETLALICYRQPMTRGEIEEIRGVSMSPNIIKTLLERGWVREVGVREVPGRPALLGTTPQFLDDFSLKSLDELPSLPEIKDPEQLEAALLRLGQTAITADAAPAQAEAPAAPDSTATVH